MSSSPKSTGSPDFFQGAKAEQLIKPHLRTGSELNFHPASKSCNKAAATRQLFWLQEHRCPGEPYTAHDTCKESYIHAKSNYNNSVHKIEQE